MKGCEGYDIEGKKNPKNERRFRSRGRGKRFCYVGFFVDSLHLSALCHGPAPEIAPERNAVTKIKVRV